MKTFKTFIYLPIIFTILSIFATPSYANNPIEGFEISLQEFESAINNMDKKLQNLSSIINTGSTVTKLESQNLNYTFFNAKELVDLNKKLLAFDRNILKSFKGNYSQYKETPPTKKHIDRIQDNISYTIKNTIADFSRRENPNRYKSLVDSLKGLENSFKRLKNASIVREGNLSSMLKTNSVNSVLNEINRLQNSLKTLKLDTGYDLASVRNTYNLLNAEELLRSSNHGWAGPYARYNISGYPGILVHNKFKLLAIYKTNNKKWSNPQSIEASCQPSDLNCSMFTCFAKMPEIAKINLDLKLDTDRSPDMGSFRYMNNGIACIKQTKYKR